MMDPRYRMTADCGRWHQVGPCMWAMVVAVPIRSRNPGYALLAALPDSADWDRVRVDWDTLITWGLAELTQPPACVTPLQAHPKAKT